MQKESNINEQQLSQEDLENVKKDHMMNSMGDGAGEMPPQQEQKETADETIADLDRKGSEELFPDGPTKNTVENWKQKYGDVYLTEFEDKVFIWRVLSRLEYKELMNSDQGRGEWEGEELIVQTCVLWPEDYGPEEIGDGKAGIPSILSDQIMAKSGFVATKRAQKL